MRAFQGASGNWENRPFNAVAEAVEFTALQRGVERWEPDSRRARATRPSARPPGAGPAADPAASEPPVLILWDPPDEQRFVTCVPFFDLEAAAGAFGPEQPEVDPAEQHTWLPVAGRRLTRDMFALRVAGRSMEPLIRDGDYGLFRGDEALAGSRNGRIVLVCLRDSVDRRGWRAGREPRMAHGSCRCPGSIWRR